MVQVIVAKIYVLFFWYGSHWSHWALQTWDSTEPVSSSLQQRPPVGNADNHVIAQHM